MSGYNLSFRIKQNSDKIRASCYSRYNRLCEVEYHHIHMLCVVKDFMFNCHMLDKHFFPCRFDKMSLLLINLCIVVYVNVNFQ